MVCTVRCFVKWSTTFDAIALTCPALSSTPGAQDVLSAWLWPDESHPVVAKQHALSEHMQGSKVSGNVQCRDRDKTMSTFRDPEGGHPQMLPAPAGLAIGGPRLDRKQFTKAIVLSGTVRPRSCTCTCTLTACLGARVRDPHSSSRMPPKIRVQPQPSTPIPSSVPGRTNGRGAPTTNR